MVLEEVWGWRPRCVLVVSTGGGGDAGSALYLARLLERDGARVVLAVLPWERYVRDPEPGPIPLRLLSGVELLGSGAAARTGPRGCVALRGGRLLEPSACRAAAAGLPVYVLDGWGGAAGASRGLEEVSGLHGCDAAVAFDVGGDVLAGGCEEGLWSPLGDSLGLAAVARLYPGEGVVAVHSPGADGELEPRLVMKRAWLVARRGGYRWVRGVPRGDRGLLEEALSLVYTEAGRVALEALAAERDELLIRRGTRRIVLGLELLMTLFLDASAAASVSVARLVNGSASLEEARRRLNEAGIYTELDLEEDISLFQARTGRLPGPGELLSIREEGRRRLRPCRGVSI